MVANGEGKRTTAILAFLAPGVPGPMTRATAVAMLADARNAIAARRSGREPISEWLANEIRARGIRECAAVFAAMEAGIDRDELPMSYRKRYPNRAGALDDVLRILDDIDRRDAAE